MVTNWRSTRHDAHNEPTNVWKQAGNHFGQKTICLHLRTDSNCNYDLLQCGKILWQPFFPHVIRIYNISVQLFTTLFIALSLSRLLSPSLSYSFSRIFAFASYFCTFASVTRLGMNPFVWNTFQQQIKKKTHTETHRYPLWTGATAHMLPIYHISSQSANTLHCTKFIGRIEQHTVERQQKNRIKRTKPKCN